MPCYSLPQLRVSWNVQANDLRYGCESYRFSLILFAFLRIFLRLFSCGCAGAKAQFKTEQYGIAEAMPCYSLPQLRVSCNAEANGFLGFRLAELHFSYPRGRAILCGLPASGEASRK
jgi:hypothetical protein